MNTNTNHQSNRRGTARCAHVGLFALQGTARCAPTERFAYRRLCSSGSGFTLVELVVTIVIIGILSSLGGMFITKPIEGYIDLERRTELVDQAEMALRRMQRDIRAALPNSVRVIEDPISLKTIGIEFLHVVDGGRYRRAVDPDDILDLDLAVSIAAKNAVLDFTQTDMSFEVLGGLNHFADVKIDSAIESDNDRVVVYNLTPTGTSQNAYLADNSKPIGATSTSSVISLGTTGMKFSYSSPYQRFFIVDEAVSYKIVGTELRRYSERTYDNTPGPSSGATVALVAKYLMLTEADGVTPLIPFLYDQGTARRSGLVTMQLALENNGERITLLHQVHVDNAP